jgi:hypothetical protein
MLHHADGMEAITNAKGESQRPPPSIAKVWRANFRMVSVAIRTNHIACVRIAQEPASKRATDSADRRKRGEKRCSTLRLNAGALAGKKHNMPIEEKRTGEIQRRPGEETPKRINWARTSGNQVVNQAEVG